MEGCRLTRANRKSKVFWVGTESNYKHSSPAMGFCKRYGSALSRQCAKSFPSKDNDFSARAMAKTPVRAPIAFQFEARCGRGAIKLEGERSPGFSSKRMPV